MARDWTDARAIRSDILERMAMHGINIAEIPFCETMYRKGDEHVWVVDIHVKVARKNEFDITAEGITLGDALKKAYLSLCHEPVRG